MRLKQLHGHYLVRVLRVFVPFLLLAALVIPLRDYLDRSSAEPAPAESPARLEVNQSELTEGLRYVTHDADETLMSVESERTLGFLDGKHLLEDVLVTFYGEDGSTPEFEIDGVRCDFEQATFRVDCDDEVEMHLDEDTTGYTTSLTYDHGNRIVRTLSTTRIERRGDFVAEADGMIVRVASKEYVLAGNVRIETEDPATVLQADRVVYREALDRVEVVGPFRLVAEDGEVQGGRGQIEMEAGTLRPRALIVQDTGIAESFRPGQQGTLKGERLDLGIENGSVRGILARGNVEAASTADGDGWTLFGNRMDASLGSGGRLELLVTTGGARMVLGTGQELRSRTIRNAVSGLVTTEGDSTLESGEYRVEGSDFQLERAGTVSFRTDRAASIETPDGTFRGLETQALFDSDTGTLLSLEQAGDIEFQMDERSGTAARLWVGPGAEEVRLEGRAQVRDSMLNLEAGEIALNRASETFTASSSVRAWLLGSDPSLMLGERAEGGAGRIVFYEAARLWWPSADTEVSASSIDLDSESRSFVARGGVVSAGQGFRVWSDRLEFDEADGRAYYSEEVRVAGEDMDASSDQLEIALVNHEPRRIVLTGDVDIRAGMFEGQADRAEYTPPTRMLILTGEDAQVSDPELGDVRGRRVEVNLETEAIVASADGHGRVVSTGVAVPR